MTTTPTLRPAPSEVRLTWAESIPRFLDWGRRKARPYSKQTVPSYESGLRTWAACFDQRGIITPRSVTSADIESIIESKPDWAGSTKGQRLTVLSSFFEWAVKQELADRNPVEDVERPRRQDNEWPMVQPDDFRRMRLQVRNVLEDALLLTLVLTGARHKELLNIDCEHIDKHLPGVTIKDGKGGKTRVVPLSPRLVEAWNRYLQDRPATKCPAFFVTEKGKRLTKRITRPMWKRWLCDAGLAERGYVIHSCRVTFCTLLDRVGVDQRTIAELMGHGPKNMTVRYTRTDMPRKQDAVARLDEALLGPAQRVLGDSAVEVAGTGVQVGGGRVEPAMPEQLRQRVEIAAALQHEAGERVSQRVQGAPLGDARALEGTAQDRRQPLAPQWGIGAGREQSVVPTAGAQLKPIGQRTDEAWDQRQQAALPPLPALDPYGALRQIDGPDLQRQQLRLAQASEDEQPQYGPVAEGVGDAGLRLGGGEQAVALLKRQPSGERALAFRDGDAQERIGVGVPVVVQVLREGPERGEPPGDAVGLVSLGAQPSDVGTDGPPVNGLNDRGAARLGETAEE